MSDSVRPSAAFTRLVWVGLVLLALLVSAALVTPTSAHPGRVPGCGPAE